MIKIIRKATDDEWDSMVDAVSTTIYFQTREWFDIWADYGGFESDTKIILFESGKKVLLPLAYISLMKGLVKARFLSPKGLGGFVTNDELDENEKRELFDFLLKPKMLYCSVNPYDSLTNGFPRFNSEDFTQVLDLSPGISVIFKNWSKGHSSAAKKGMRDGITVEKASTEDEWKSYFGIYQDTLKRWGANATNKYAWELFEIIYKKESKKVNLWLAKYQGELVSGALCFYHNRHVAYWHGATSEQFFRKVNASHVLQYHIIEDACDKGFLLYDFLPSGGIEGVIDFKKGFSPQKKAVHIYMSPFMQFSNTMRNRLRNSAAYNVIMKNTGF